MSYLKGLKRLSTLTGLRQFLKILSGKEKKLFFIFLLLIISSGSFLLINFYLKNTELIAAEGGVYTEGLVGSPRLINPAYTASSDTDRDLIELIYSGLIKYDENGKIIADLAEKYEILEDGKVYEFYLKKDLLWSDNTPLTAEDIIFTIKTIQNPEIKSSQRVNWLGVEVEKISEFVVSFKLKNPSAVFLENCTLKILPKHIWQTISAQQFPLSVRNLNPVGSGPYKLKGLVQDIIGNIISLELVKNPNYSGSFPNIPKIVFYFFDSEKELISAFNSGKINGFSILSPEQDQNVGNSEFTSYHLSLPRYFAVFFNPDKSKILAETEIRQALNYGTNKEELLSEILLNQGKIVNSPILPEIFNFKAPSEIYEFNPEKAGNLLSEAGFLESGEGARVKVLKKTASFQFQNDLKVGSQGNEVKELQKCLANPPAGGTDIYPEAEISGYFGQKTKTAVIRFQEKYKSEVLEPYGLTSGTGSVLKSTRAKLNELCFPTSEENIPLSFSLATVNQPLLETTANLLKEQWEAIGINLEIKTFDISSLEQEVIKPRDYDMLLFGEVLDVLPDPFPFWHSSQVKDPGLNLAGYENKTADKLLEGARQTLDETERKEKLEEFQEILLEDAPALFLYNPDYLYLVSNQVKGIQAKIITDPSKRFSGIENWYIKTKRAWK